MRARPRGAARTRRSSTDGTARIRSGRRRTGSESGSRSRAAPARACREAAERRSHEQLEAGQHRERVAGQRDHDAAVALAAPGGLPWLQRDAPEQLAHAQLAQRRLDVVVRPDGDAARRQHEIGRLERARERLPRCLGIVGNPLHADELGTERDAARCEEAAVRLVDLPAPQRLGRRRSSSPVTTTRPAGGDAPRSPRCRRRSGPRARAARSRRPPAAPRRPGAGRCRSRARGRRA